MAELQVLVIVLFFCISCTTPNNSLNASCKPGYVYMNKGLPYLFEYNAQNFVQNFNQKLRMRVIHEFFHQHALFLFLFFGH